MLITSLEYSQFATKPRVWALQGCTFEKINLIVGKNATGKTKVLNVIGNLARLLVGERKSFGSANYQRVEFRENGTMLDYSLEYEEDKVIREILDIDGQDKIRREADGVSEIYYEKEGHPIAIKAPDNEIISFNRRDSVQHPFLEYLHDWGESVRHFNFGKTLGQDGLASFGKDDEKQRERMLNLKDTNRVVEILREGYNRFGSIFHESIIGEMGEIGYELDDIGVKPIRGVSFTGIAPVPVKLDEIFGIYVKESDLGDITSQPEMSQGMFRALSLIIQIKYAELTKIPVCMLIDDIGEGLDYERSSALIQLLVRKAKEASVQLIMATNDRFVMNNVDLEYWSIIRRAGNISRMYNSRNAKAMFDDFASTGLNNFDLFSSEFYLKEYGES